MHGERREHIPLLVAGVAHRGGERPTERVVEEDVQLFLGLIETRRAAGLSFAESMLAGYAAVPLGTGRWSVAVVPERLSDSRASR